MNPAAWVEFPFTDGKKSENAKLAAAKILSKEIGPATTPKIRTLFSQTQIGVGTLQNPSSIRTQQVIDEDFGGFFWFSFDVQRIVRGAPVPYDGSGIAFTFQLSNSRIPQNTLYPVSAFQTFASGLPEGLFEIPFRQQEEITLEVFNRGNIVLLISTYLNVLEVRR